MKQTPDDIAQNLAEHWCLEVGRRDDSRVARRLYCRHLMEGVYRIYEGALQDDIFHFLDQVGVMGMLSLADNTHCGKAFCVTAQNLRNNPVFRVGHRVQRRTDAENSPITPALAYDGCR
jgi:hypothetical protein